jgi:nicotinamide mononucleotide adenylyltransferase
MVKQAKQSSYQRTLTVLSRVEAAVNSHGFAAQEKVKVMLLCGTDLLQSVTKPGVWLPEQVRALLQEHGVVCICTSGQDTRQLLFEHDILFNNRRQIMIVDELIHNDVSSTKVRRNIMRGLSVKYLIADSVINYIKTHQLYTTNPVAHQA